MKAVIAMDSFKGCLSAMQASEAVATGIASAMPQCKTTIVPVSDGGDGLLSTLSIDTETITVTGPLPHMKVEARIGYRGDTAIIESAQACGLSLLAPSERNPMLTTTAGVGEMIQHAIGRRCKRIVIGLGGSATNDLGIGMLTALGVEFLDLNGNILAPCGENIAQICQLRNTENLRSKLKGIEIIAACDVNNPLYGPNGAACIYAPQKGATPHMVSVLERGAQALCKVIDQDIALRPGAGAAGGMGYALMAMCGCRYSSGADFVLDLLDFDSTCRDASIVITGEGSSDHQTLMGKIPSAVMRRAKRMGKPTTLLSGKITNGKELLDAGFCSVNAVSPADMPLEIAMIPEVAIQNLELAASNLINRLFKTHSRCRLDGRHNITGTQ